MQLMRWCPRAPGMTSCVCVTTAQSLPSLAADLASARPSSCGPCGTPCMSARTVEPSGAPRRNLVLDSIVVVRAFGGRFDEGRDAAERVGERHEGAAVHRLAGRAQIGAHAQRRDDAFGRHLDELQPHQAGKERGEQCAGSSAGLGHGAVARASTDAPRAMVAGAVAARRRTPGSASARVESVASAGCRRGIDTSGAPAAARSVHTTAQRDAGLVDRAGLEPRAARCCNSASSASTAACSWPRTRSSHGSCCFSVGRRLRS